MGKLEIFKIPLIKTTAEFFLMEKAFKTHKNNLRILRLLKESLLESNLGILGKSQLASHLDLSQKSTDT